MRGIEGAVMLAEPGARWQVVVPARREIYYGWSSYPVRSRRPRRLFKASNHMAWHPGVPLPHIRRYRRGAQAAVVQGGGVCCYI